MKPKEKDYKEAFARMTNSLDFFVREVKNKKSTLMATKKWTVKDVLCHIVFWHTNYAANYRALVLKEIPPLLEGPGYKLNAEGVKSLRKYSIKNLIRKLHSAQACLHQSIVLCKIPQMTYKKSTNRIYKTNDFLYLVERHLFNHALQIRRAKEIKSL